MAKWTTNAPNGKNVTLNRGYRNVTLNHRQVIIDRDLAEAFPQIFTMLVDDFQPQLTKKPELKEEVNLETELLTEPAPSAEAEVEESDELETEVLTEPAPVTKTKGKKEKKKKTSKKILEG